MRRSEDAARRRRPASAESMNRQLKRILVLIVGWAFILVGIAGLFLPVIQGILCIIIGLMILSSEYVWAHNLLQKLKARFPRMAALSEQGKEKAQEWLARLTRRQKRESTSCPAGENTESEAARARVDDR